MNWVRGHADAAAIRSGGWLLCPLACWHVKAGAAPTKLRPTAAHLLKLLLCRDGNRAATYAAQHGHSQCVAILKAKGFTPDEEQVNEVGCDNSCILLMAVVFLETAAGCTDGSCLPS